VKKSKATPKNQSAGLLLYRRKQSAVEVLLAHPGGPFWQRKDEGAWTVPKGLIASGEAPLTAAKREFFEETGHSPEGEFLPLREAKQPGGKTVHVWAVEGDWDTASLRSNMFEMERPPRSGRRQSFPEIDRAEWFSVEAARTKVLTARGTYSTIATLQRYHIARL
jgi:predicted NUDIX family NTP pyrophosphohydrolase